MGLFGSYGNLEEIPEVRKKEIEAALAEYRAIIGPNGVAPIT